ncbi:MAG: hypothetical protein H7245_06855 [Candidatus Saccharibacteria bacterium]|nr:hypothetical protein [Pseudorhodobacter sp.]
MGGDIGKGWSRAAAVRSGTSIGNAVTGGGMGAMIAGGGTAVSGGAAGGFVATGTTVVRTAAKASAACRDASKAAGSAVTGTTVPN